MYVCVNVCMLVRLSIRVRAGQEDKLVQSLVRQHGGSEEELNDPKLGASNIKWLLIGEQVPNRSGKQCRERWSATEF